MKAETRLRFTRSEIAKALMLHLCKTHQFGFSPGDENAVPDKSFAVLDWEISDFNGAEELVVTIERIGQ